MAFRVYGSGIPKDDEEGHREAAARSARSTVPPAMMESPQVAAVVEEVGAFREATIAKFASFTFGNPFASCVVVKTLVPAALSPAGPEGHDPASMGQAPDYQALQKALISMGYDQDDVLGIWVGSEQLGSAVASDPATLRTVTELVDPVAVVALDSFASKALMAAFADCQLEAGDMRDGLGFGWIAGRKHVHLADFAADLASPERKRSAWEVLKRLGL